MDLQFEWAPISSPAARLAGLAFAQSRQKKGHKTAVLADFLIGAQAQVEPYLRLTRDAARYKTYFPVIRLRNS